MYIVIPFLFLCLNPLDKVVKSDSSEIEDEDVTFVDSLLVKTIGNGSGGRLVDDLKDIHS